MPTRHPCTPALCQSVSQSVSLSHLSSPDRDPGSALSIDRPLLIKISTQVPLPLPLGRVPRSPAGRGAREGGAAGGSVAPLARVAARARRPGHAVHSSRHAVAWQCSATRDFARAALSRARGLAGLFSPEQLKILAGNLQINASLTVVFEVPWPPIHLRYLGVLNIFKLDLFKGLALAAPCVHASHFMSLASFVGAPIVLLSALALALCLVGV